VGGTRTLSTEGLAPDRGALLTWAAVLNGELALVLLYFAVSSATPTDVVSLAYPFVWLNVAAWGVHRVGVPDASRRQWLAAAGVGAAYFLVLGRVGGLYMLHGADLGSRVAWLAPGWGPAVIYSGAGLTVSLLPFKVGGYAALAYLVAVTVVDTARTGLAGLVGLLSCVSCTWPVVATLAAGLFGSASTAVVVAESQPYALSTAVFVSSVLLLTWRPGRR
jgi:hypothetical protein